MARKMFREAVEIYSTAGSNSPVIANKIGIAYHQMMEMELARRNYERAVKLDPKYSEAVNNLGTIYYARKNYRKAVSYYNRALKLKPNSASIYSNLGTAQFARKKYKAGARSLRYCPSARSGGVRAPRNPGRAPAGAKRGRTREVPLLSR